MTDYLKIFTLVTVWIFIIILVSLMVTVVKYKNLINQDPLNYGMKLHSFYTCSCLDDKERNWNSLPTGGFVYRTIGTPNKYIEVNYSSINFTQP